MNRGFMGKQRHNHCNRRAQVPHNQRKWDRAGWMWRQCCPLSLFLDFIYFVHHEYAWSDGQSIRNTINVLEHLQENVLWDKNWDLHHDNAIAHHSSQSFNFWLKHSCASPTSLFPWYSPCLLLLVSKLKLPLKGNRRDSNRRGHNNFQECFQIRNMESVQPEGDYSVHPTQ